MTLTCPVQKGNAACLMHQAAPAWQILLHYWQSCGFKKPHVMHLAQPPTIQVCQAYLVCRKGYQRHQLLRSRPQLMPSSITSTHGG